MPGILKELINLVIAIKKEDKALDGIKKFGKLYMGKKSNLLKIALENISGENEVSMRKALGDEVTNHIKKQFGTKINKNRPIETFNVEGRSSWVRTLAWSPILSTATLTVQDISNRNQVYKLPFFPKSAIQLIQNGASPGKTIWRRYWRVFGKGRFINKARNKIRVETTKSAVRIINKAVPTLKIPKIGPNRVYNKNLIARNLVRTSNIPKTGAKGVSIKIRTPKLRKY